MCPATPAEHLLTTVPPFTDDLESLCQRGAYHNKEVKSFLADYELSLRSNDPLLKECEVSPFIFYA